MQRALGRIEGKLDALAEQQKDILAYCRGLAERIRTLERVKAWAVGVAAGVSALVAWVLS